MTRAVNGWSARVIHLASSMRLFGSTAADTNTRGNAGTTTDSFCFGLPRLKTNVFAASPFWMAQAAAAGGGSRASIS